MNPTDTALWRRGLEKLATGPSALTDAEREVIAFYGSDTDRRRLSDALSPREPAPLTVKADTTPAPAQGVSKAALRKAFESYTEGLAATFKQALEQRDARIKELEIYVNGLSKALSQELEHRDGRILALADRLVALEADQAVGELVP